MDIKDMQVNAHRNATDKGFHNLEHSILNKMLINNVFTSEEYNAVLNAFMGLGLMLIVSEASEALEARRKNDEDNFGEEICDVAIRLGDFSENYGVDLDGEIVKKMGINKLRDKMHGKKF